MTESHTTTVPTPAQRKTIRDILWSCPRLVEGGPLSLMYAAHRKREAAWVCAFARAAGVEVSLEKLSRRPARPTTGEDATVIALTDDHIDLPADAVQLFGSETASPLDLWASPTDVALADRTVADMFTGRSSVVVPSADAEAILEASSVSIGGRPGTVEIAVRDLNGWFVADAAIGVNRPVEWDARLAPHPVTLEIEEGKVLSVDGGDATKNGFLRRAISVHHADHVTFLRVGTRGGEIKASAVDGPANTVRRNIALCLSVPPGRGYLATSSDLRIDLSAEWDGEFQ